MTPTRAQSDRLALIAKNARRPLDEVVEVWNERAAIREYLGGKQRKEAEQLALDDTANVLLGPSSLERWAGPR